MHHTQLSLRTWFIAMYLDAESKRGISAVELARKIGVRYTSAWYVLGRLRSAMSQREEHYLLDGEVDVDDMFVGGVSPGRPGRSTHKVPCLIAVSLDEHSHPKYMRVTPVNGWDQSEVTGRILDMVDVNATLKTDGMGGFNRLFRHGLHPYPEPSRHAWARTSTSPRSCTPTIANLKAQMQGTYHRRPSKRYIESYLNEHCFLFNRRHMRVSDHGQAAKRLRTECADPSRRVRLSDTARTESLVNARL
ncbi:MAG: IS1595 family transposase [Ferrimicrobium sp.]